MTKEEIIEMVMQIGGCDRPEDDSPALRMFETFAKLVAEKEREACAKLCEDDDSNAGEWHWEAHVGGYFAKAIRARRQE